MKHFLNFSDLPPRCDSKALYTLLDRARDFKRGATRDAMRGKTAVLLFEKPSLRTKLSFTLAVEKLGGSAIYFAPQEVGLGTREPVADVAKVVSRMADMVIVRTFDQGKLVEFAEHSSVPVVNALSDAEHPCQTLADLMTMRELKQDDFGGEKLKVAYIGDGNNVAVSLAWGVVTSGNLFSIATPEGFGLPPRSVREIEHQITALNRPEEAVENADVVYTDAWVSMGQEDKRKKKLAAFKGYRVTPTLMKLAKEDAILMHPLPAHAGEEIEEGMLDSPYSVCFQQAENRLWAQMVLIERLARIEQDGSGGQE